MQRILKYHLLLRELKKHSTTASREDQADLQKALDVMLDIAVFINEVKRDNEMIDLIKSIESSIVEQEMPENTHFTSWGRLLIDGLVRFRPHESTAIKTRYACVLCRFVANLPVKTIGNSRKFAFLHLSLDAWAIFLSIFSKFILNFIYFGLVLLLQLISRSGKFVFFRIESCMKFLHKIPMFRSSETKK